MCDIREDFDLSHSTGQQNRHKDVQWQLWISSETFRVATANLEGMFTFNRTLAVANGNAGLFLSYLPQSVLMDGAPTTRIMHFPWH